MLYEVPGGSQVDALPPAPSRSLLALRYPGLGPNKYLGEIQSFGASEEFKRGAGLVGRFDQKRGRDDLGRIVDHCETCDH